jgi:queuine/archaeosine tRNA-ribosyltransferase
MGLSLVKPSKYMDSVLAMNPDFFISLVDETYSHPSRRRSENIVARSAKWLEECLERCEVHNEALPQGQAPVAVIGSIAGCAVMQQGHRVAQSVVQHDNKLAGAKFQVQSVVHYDAMLAGANSCYDSHCRPT